MVFPSSLLLLNLKLTGEPACYKWKCSDNKADVVLWTPETLDLAKPTPTEQLLETIWPCITCFPWCINPHDNPQFFKNIFIIHIPEVLTLLLTKKLGMVFVPRYSPPVDIYKGGRA